MCKFDVTIRFRIFTKKTNIVCDDGCESCTRNACLCGRQITDSIRGDITGFVLRCHVVAELVLLCLALLLCVCLTQCFVE